MIPLTMSARVGAPAERIREALTDPVQMRTWLAEHAKADLPGSYAFWGRHTPEGEAPHQQPIRTSDHGLSFTWRLAERQTSVEIALREEQPGSTIITVLQTDFDFTDLGSLGMLQTFWALSVANLVDHLENRPLTPRCDYTSAQLSAEILIDAAPAAVYESLIDADQVGRWFGFPVEIDPRVGGRYGHGGKILNLDRERVLTVEWEGTGVFTWALADVGGRTHLTLSRSGFDPARPPYAAWAGELCGAAELRRYHELTDWQPIWLHDAHAQHDD